MDESFVGWFIHLQKKHLRTNAQVVILTHQFHFYKRFSLELYTDLLINQEFLMRF